MQVWDTGDGAATLSEEEDFGVDASLVCMAWQDTQGSAGKLKELIAKN